MFRAHRPLAPFVLHSMVTMRTFVTMRTLLIAAMSGLAVLIVVIGNCGYTTAFTSQQGEICLAVAVHVVPRRIGRL